MPRHPTEENVEALKGIGRKPAQDRRRRQGAGRCRGAKRLAGRAVETGRFQSGDARQGAGDFRQPAEGGVRPAQEHLQAAPVSLKTLPPDLVSRLEDQGRPDPRRGAAEGRSQRQRYICASLRTACWPPSRMRSAARSRFSSPATPSSTAFIHAGIWALLVISVLLWLALAPDHRRAADAGAAAGGRRGDAGNLCADRACRSTSPTSSPCRCCSASASPSRSITSRRGGRAGHNLLQSSLTRAIFFSRADDGDRVRQPLAIESSRHREHG